MANFKVDFNTNDIMKKIENQIRNNPKAVMKENVGKRLDAKCPKCSNTGLTITRDGDAKCNNTDCKAIIRVDLTI